MREFTKKALSVLVAAAISTGAVSLNVLNTSAADGTKYEFEDGDTGTSAVKEDAGASGGKYVYLEKNEESISVTVPAESAGMYNVSIRYSAPFGDKVQNLYVNGVDQGQCSFLETAEGEWVDLNFGSVKLNEGDNTIMIKGSWGWTNFDYVAVESATLPDIYASDVTCCDKDATTETQNLMSYLGSVYGKHIISGQQEIYMYGPHDFEYEFDYIKDKTGKLPAIRGFDFLNCANILYGSEDGTTDRMIDWVKNKNGIITSSWHVTVPNDFTNYEIGVTKVDWSNATYDPKKTDFDTAKAVVEGTKEYEYYMLCLEALAEQIQKLQDANVPIILRPLHEAEGGGGESGSWFWWGKAGSAVYKDLWKLTYNTLTEKYGLHNIIWEWNSYAYATSENWYPGDEYVDLIAYDKYNCTDWSTGSPVLVHNDSAISSTFYTIMEKYGSKKMVAMAENDSIPTLNNLVTEKAGWLYFCPWYDGGSDDTNFLSNPMFNKEEDLIEIYQSDYCITLDELPETLYSDKSDIETKPTTTADPNKTTTTTTTTEADPTKIPGTVSPTKTGYKVSFDREIGDTIILDFAANANVSYANGGVGVSAPVDGTDYWVNYQWEISKTGEITLKLDKPLNVTAGTDEVTDEAIIAKAIEASHAQKDVEVQVWWANDGEGESVDTANVVLKNAYLPSDSGEQTTTTEETTATSSEETTESSEETTTEVTTAESTESSNTDETTTTTTTAATETTTTSETDTTTTESTGGKVEVSLYGDINLDGKIDLTDAIMLNKAMAEVVTLTDQQAANADCDGNGSLDGNDAIVLLRFLVQIVSSLPSAE